MGLKEWLAENGIYEEKRVPQKPEAKPFTIKRRAPNPDELTLGYGQTKDKDGNTIGVLKGVPQSSRATHFYIVGASGTGKTRFLESLALQDVRYGNGFAIIDAHSDLTEEFKGMLFLQTWKDGDFTFLHENVVLIDPSDPDNTVCFNPLERADGMDADAVAGELVEVFKKIWHDAWGARMERLLTNTLYALIENNLTLAELPPFLTDFKFRRKIMEKVENAFCRDYFNNFDALPAKTQREWAESTLNKVGAFLGDTKVRQMFISPKSTFSFRDVMDNKKILLVKLDRGRLKGSADLLGSLILAKIQMTAFARTDQIEAERAPFYLYVDEFQNFAIESFIETLAQSRKYKLPLILAHQQLGQLSPALRASVLTNCGLQAYFRISRADADILAKESLASIYNNPPGWEWYIQQLQELPSRFFIFKVKDGGDVVKMYSQAAGDAHEAVNADAATFAKVVSMAEIGKNYLRPRKEVEDEYKKRREGLFEEHEQEIFKERKQGTKNDLKYKEIIRGGENNHVEFKASLRWSYEQGKTNKAIEHIVAKALSAFMNSEGGTLFIGVGDKGEILGIEKDYATLRKNRDDFLLQLTNIINQHLGKEFNQFTDVKIVPIDGKDVCIVETRMSKMPVYLKSGDKEEFYIRASASSQPMGVRETNEYIRTHFSEMEFGEFDASK